MKFHSYYKLPAAQTSEENCVAHNGSLLPIPGRDVMVQGFYQGGITVFDWTDPAKPKEIAFFDRGPLDGTRMRSAGSWSVYWYNGVIVSSEISRGLDIFELVPSAFISANEIAAAKTVRWDELNTQGQPKIVFLPSLRSRARISISSSATRVSPLNASRRCALRLPPRRRTQAPSGRTRSARWQPRCTAKPTAPRMRPRRTCWPARSGRWLRRLASFVSFVPYIVEHRDIFWVAVLFISYLWLPDLA
jgi:hypothetical protein